MVRITVVASAPESALRWPDTAYPAHLPADLTAALCARGHDAEVHVLPAVSSGPGGDHAYAAAADHGARLAERLRETDDGQRPVLHAIDPAAGLACVAARSAVPAPVVLRWGALPPAPSPAERRLRVAALRAADAVVCPSEVLARQARGGGASRVSVVPDGVDSAALAGGRSVPAEEPVLVSLSGAGAGGGARAVLESLRALPDARLVVAGRADPGAEERLLDEAERVGVVNRVEVLGWVERKEALDLLSQASVVLAPRPGATSALAALEAMCRARPVVATDVPVLADAVAHRTTGLLVRPGDAAGLASAVRTLLADPFRREAWGEAGQDRVSATFDWARVVPLLEAVYSATAPEVARS